MIPLDRKTNDLRGRRFGRLAVPADAEPDLSDGHARWPFLCDCTERDSSYVPHRKSLESVDAVGAVVRDPVLLFARQAVAFELEQFLGQDVLDGNVRRQTNCNHDMAGSLEGLL